MTRVDVALATINRLESLIMTLSGLAAQSHTRLRVIVADQSDAPVGDNEVVQALGRVIEARGGAFEYHHRPGRRGIAEQRHFLHERSRADYVLSIDDDVFIEPWVVARLLEVIRAQGCGFVGAFPAGLSHRGDVRPEQHAVEPWDGPVRTETIEPDVSPEWERWHNHRAANTYHAALELPPGEALIYKVAWVACCVLYDREKLDQVGAYRFWERLPRWHSGEDVLAQNLLMRRWGGCAILPSGAYHSEVPSTTLNARGTVDKHALDLLPEMIARYIPAVAVSGRGGRLQSSS
jgi:GT2 family glycosyltransferase